MAVAAAEQQTATQHSSAAHAAGNKGPMKVKPMYALIAIVVIIVLSGLIYFVTASPTVGVNDTVQVYYTGKFTNGTVFDSNVGKQTLNFTVGTGQLIPGFDQGVVGMKLNQNKTLTVPPNLGYGPVNPALIIIVPIKKFGNQTVQKGTVVTQVANGQQVQGTVTSVNATNATINFNPPLAGLTLVFIVRVVAIHKKQ